MSVEGGLALELWLDEVAAPVPVGGLVGDADDAVDALADQDPLLVAVGGGVGRELDALAGRTLDGGGGAHRGAPGGVGGGHGRNAGGRSPAREPERSEGPSGSPVASATGAAGP